MTATIDTTRTIAPLARRPFGLVRHSLLLAGRSLTKNRRNPGLLSDALFVPIIFLLLFVYLFGGAVSGSTHRYLQYIFPGVLVMTAILVGMLATGLSINTDIKKGVFEKDPFVTLDQEGVGDLVRIAAERGRKTRADVKLGICGEHGGDPASIAFCETVGLDYVSCSPYRVPIARLAAAQAALGKQ